MPEIVLQKKGLLKKKILDILIAIQEINAEAYTVKPELFKPIMKDLLKNEYEEHKAVARWLDTLLKERDAYIRLKKDFDSHEDFNRYNLVDTLVRVEGVSQDVAEEAVGYLAYMAGFEADYVFAPLKTQRPIEKPSDIDVIPAGPKRSRFVFYKKSVVITACVVVVILLAGGFTLFIRSWQAERLLKADNDAENPMDAPGNSGTDIRSALEDPPETHDIFALPITAETQKTLTDILGVYDLSDGYKPHARVEMPAGIIKLAVSPDENFIAALSLGTLTVVETDTGGIAAWLPAINSALADVKFIDGDSFVYAGHNGISLFDIRGNKNVWAGDMASAIAVSADGTVISGVWRDETFARVYAPDGRIINTIDFNGKHLRLPINDQVIDPEDNIFALNADGTLLAVSFSDGSLSVYKLGSGVGTTETIDILDETDYTHFEGGFSGKYFAFSATQSGKSAFTVIDMEALAQTDGFAAPEQLSVQADESGIFLSFRGSRAKYDPVTFEETDPDYERPPAKYRYVHSLDNSYINIEALKSHSDKYILSYDPFYQHSEARLSESGQTVMLFSIDSFRLYKIDGELLAETAFEEGIYDQQYRRAQGRSYLEVTWHDGTVREYSAANGEALSEYTVPPPNPNLQEEFFTDKLRIISPLHGAPTVYDLESGEFLRELDKNDYLTYVTQMGDYIVTQYIRAEDMSHYGLLMDENCETLAYLPNLCDVAGDKFIFDFKDEGYLRKTRLYPLDELVMMARETHLSPLS